jgi:hypothetical protein
MAHGAQESMPHLEKIYAFMTQNGLGVAPAIADEVKRQMKEGERKTKRRNKKTLREFFGGA